MTRLTNIVTVTVGLMIPATFATAEDQLKQYPNYYAGIRAIKDHDCKGATGYLSAYLRNHPVIREKHPEFYEAVKINIDRCAGKIIISGVGDESLEIDPLPDHPPAMDN